MTLLLWDQPKSIQDVPGYQEARTGKDWRARYQETMRIAMEYHRKWKAWVIKNGKRVDRVEVKHRLNHVQVLIKAYPSGNIELSMNGTLTLSEQDRDNLWTAFEEALVAVKEAR